jgi:hypothetical protein
MDKSYSLAMSSLSDNGLLPGDSSAGDGDSDGGMIAPELFSNGPGMKVLLDEECNKFIDKILFHRVHF